MTLDVLVYLADRRIRTSNLRQRCESYPQHRKGACYLNFLSESWVYQNGTLSGRILYLGTGLVFTMNAIPKGMMKNPDFQVDTGLDVIDLTSDAVERTISDWGGRIEFRPEYFLDTESLEKRESFQELGVREKLRHVLERTEASFAAKLITQTRSMLENLQTKKRKLKDPEVKARLVRVTEKFESLTQKISGWEFVPKEPKDEKQARSIAGKKKKPGQASPENSKADLLSTDRLLNGGDEGSRTPDL